MRDFFLYLEAIEYTPNVFRYLFREPGTNNS